MRFLVDRCAGRRLADWLRQQGHDVEESREHGPDPGDRQLLQRAADSDRVLVTLDKHFGEFIFLERRPHGGLVRLPDVTPEQRIALLNTVLGRFPAGIPAQTVVTVRGNRVRVSSSPR